MKHLSVVIPVMNEEVNMPPLIKQLSQNLEGLDYEVIFIDDGSTDQTFDTIHTNIPNERFQVIQLRTNYGQSTAMLAGIDYADSAYIATMDGDLQNDPEDIPRLLHALENEPIDMVAGNRKNRKDGFFNRKLPSKLANSLIRQFTGVKITDYGCTLKVIDGSIAKNLGLYGEMHRFIPVLAKQEGARIKEMDVQHHPRQYGYTKYGLSRTFKVLSDLLLVMFFQKYLNKPMQLFGLAGIVVFAVGVLLNLYLLGLKIAGTDLWGKPLLILAMTCTLGGIQLVTIGILVEMLMRTYYESQSKKTYKVRFIARGSKTGQKQKLVDVK